METRIMSKRLIVGSSWKMMKSRQQARGYIDTLKRTLGSFDSDRIRAYILPAFTLLDTVRDALADYPVEVGSQNVHWAEEGAFTGEVSAAMIQEAGCTIAMIGHSERRFLFGETDQTVAKRVRAACQHGITPLICIGETREERDSGETAAVLQRQFLTVLGELPHDFVSQALVLYEPRWAIGAKEPAPLEYIHSTHTLMRGLLSRLFNEQTAAAVSLVYGGSVNLENFEQILRLPDVDGCGIGRASWDAEDFATMVKLTEKVAHESQSSIHV
jgi:triosephosphate isomerase